MSESTYPSVNDLTLEEKASLTSGGDAWHLQGVEANGSRLLINRRPPRPAQVQLGHHRRSRPEQLRACHLLPAGGWSVQLLESGTHPPGWAKPWPKSAFRRRSP